MDSLNPPPPAPNSFYVPLLISMIGVFSTCIALVVYHFILIRYCKRRTETTPSGADQAQEVPQDPFLPTGVDPKLLETIPIIAYSSTQEGGQDHLFRADQSECVVCLGELEHAELVRLLPNCKHAFHVQCIDEWFVAHSSCPICRYPIVPVNNDAPLRHPPLLDGSNRVVDIPADQDHEHASGNDDASSLPGVKGQSSFGLLRHCGSLVLPRERPSSSARSITGLKRSLSLDQSSVIIDIQKESGRDGSSSSSGPRSIRRLDRVSTKLRISFSRLRSGKNTEILPY